MKTIIAVGKDLVNGFEKNGIVHKLICKNCVVTCVGETGRLLNTRVKEHKKNLGRNCNCYKVLSEMYTKEYADHNFDWSNVEILQLENNKGKGKFMKMLYTVIALR